MKTKRSARLSAASRRERIVQAGVEVFGRVGYGGASMNEIAAASGVTKPVLYDHFPSKLKLYGALLEVIRDALLAQGAAIAREPNGREERFRAAVYVFFGFAKAQPDQIRVLLQMPQTDPAAAKMWKKVQAGATAGIAALLGSVWHASDPRSQLAAAELVKSGLHALAEWSIAHPEVEIDALTDVVMQVMWKGLNASSSR